MSESHASASPAEIRAQWVDQFRFVLEQVPDDRLVELDSFLELELQQLGALAEMGR